MLSFYTAKLTDGGKKMEGNMAYLPISWINVWVWDKNMLKQLR